MTVEVETFEIPAGIEPEVKVVADILRDVLSLRLNEPVDVGVIEGDARGFLGEAGAALLYLPVAALAIISKKWLEDCVWPEVKKRVAGPTQKTVDFIIDLASRGSKAKANV